MIKAFTLLPLILMPLCLIETSNCSKSLPPKVLIALFVRNKGHTLPHFLKLLEDLEYPKERISLYIRCDHSLDVSAVLLEHWLNEMQALGNYHSYNVSIVSIKEEEKLNRDPFPDVSWDSARFDWMMRLKEGALEHGRRVWADWIWFLDADAFITDPSALAHVLSSGESKVAEVVVLAPMLRSMGLYSNFWAGMSESYYYERTEEYEPILNRKKVGCHVVPMVHSCFLINLNHEDAAHLSFLPEKMKDYDGPKDDIIVFALSAKRHSIPLTLCNDRPYGYIMPPLDEGSSLEDDYANLVNLRIESISSHDPKLLPFISKLNHYVRRPLMNDTLGVDHVYTINLERRPDRRRRMESVYVELGVNTEWSPAVDGRKMTQKDIDELGIKMMPGFLEPYHERPLKLGEIGCFLSHYNIWVDMLEKGYERVIIFEDDIKFEPFFRAKLEQLLEELDDLEDYWDLTFLGRKILHDSVEPWLQGSSQLVHVDYTYWTLSYVLSREGARKLVEEKPLGKMVPVDEYLPIMYDKHPNAEWKSHFGNRNLKALSVYPLLVQPTHYTGDDGYISDTEDSSLIENDNNKEPHLSNTSDKDEL